MHLDWSGGVKCVTYRITHECIKSPELGWTSDEQDGFYDLLRTTDDPDTVHGAPKAKASILDKECKEIS